GPLRLACGGRDVLAVPAVAVLVTGLGELGDAAHLLAGALEADQPDPLRVPADDRDVVHLDPDQHPAVGDQHHLVPVLHLRQADDVAVPLGGLDVDDALAPATLDPILGLLGALAVAVRGDGEDGGARLDHVGAHHLVTRVEGDALHAVGLAAHRADL